MKDAISTISFKTAKDAKSAKALPGVRQTLRDAGVPNLRLVIQPQPKTAGMDAAKTFTFIYDRSIAGKKRKRKLTIGRFNPLATSGTKAIDPVTGFNGTVKSAKSIAAGWSLILENRDDPADVIERRKEKIAAEHRARADVKSFKEWTTAFIQDCESQGEPRKSTREHYGYMFKHVEGPWKDQDLRKVTPAIARDLLATTHDKINKRRDWEDRNPATANRVHTALSALFRWMMKQDEPAIVSNPMKSVKKIGAKHRDDESTVQEPAERPRKRVLTLDELKRVWSAAVAMEDVYGKWMGLLMMTAVRKGELAKIQWTDLKLEHDSDGKIVGAAMTIANKGRSIKKPLGTQAVAILNTITAKPGNPFVFASNRKENASIDPRAKELARFHSASKTSNWNFHDIRRTASTMAQDQLRLPERDAKLLLGHAFGSGVTGRHYTATDFWNAHREAVDAWEAHLMTIVNETDEVEVA